MAQELLQSACFFRILEMQHLLLFLHLAAVEGASVWLP